MLCCRNSRKNMEIGASSKHSRRATSCRLQQSLRETRRCRYLRNREADRSFSGFYQEQLMGKLFFKLSPRLFVLLLVVVGGVVLAIAFGPVPQPLAYHR